MRFWNKNHRRRSDLHYVEANTDREWLSVGKISSEARSMQIRPSGLQGYYSLNPDFKPNMQRAGVQDFHREVGIIYSEEKCRVRNLLPPIRIERQSVLCKQKNRQNGILD